LQETLIQNNPYFTPPVHQAHSFPSSSKASYEPAGLLSASRTGSLALSAWADGSHVNRHAWFSANLLPEVQNSFISSRELPAISTPAWLLLQPETEMDAIEQLRRRRRHRVFSDNEVLWPSLNSENQSGKLLCFENFL
ncbi:unnamed protein product, partial [Protopolystoma xenopodis]